jgi:hypothetical protein
MHGMGGMGGMHGMGMGMMGMGHRGMGGMGMGMMERAPDVSKKFVKPTPVDVLAPFYEVTFDA